jgi:hypothetical protein
VPRPCRILFDEEEAVLADLPHTLGLLGDEAGFRAEQTLVPGPRGGVVGDADPGEEVDRYTAGSYPRGEARRSAERD